jgi:ribosomal protein S18 acetylase RimI-like enzyme
VGWTRGQKTLPCHLTAAGVDYEAECMNAFVLPEYQGRGVGRALWRAMWDAVMALHRPRNFVVWSADRAVGFYQSLGGEVSERRAFCEGSHPSTAVVWNDVSDQSRIHF